VYYHPFIIREATAAIKKNPEKINEKYGYKCSNIWSQLSPLPELRI
jgi:hypothetical protein